MSRKKYWMVVTGLILPLAGVYCGWGQPKYSAPADQPVPVLVELFTSEGCSDCPPADELLAQIAAQSPAGVAVVAMSEHVDYWNRLGWSDPFSDAQFSRRQEAYGLAFDSDSYTPEMIVDGEAHFVGSNRNFALQSLRRAAQKPKATIELTKTVDAGERRSFQVRMTPATGLVSNGPFDVYLALTENNLSSNVVRGENRGRRLNHVAVVRKLSLIGRGDGKAGFAAATVVKLDPHWILQDAQVIAFAQSRKTRAILAVSTTPLAQGNPSN